MPLSTPIQNLPTASQAAGNATPPEDPEVLQIIEEIEDMEGQIQAQAAAASSAPTATVAHPASPPPPSSWAPPTPVATHPLPIARKQEPRSLWTWNRENAQNALMAAVVALVLFYPRTLQVVYDRLPERYQVLVRPYDLLLRALLLALALYVLFWKLQA